jgi:hypothetical protein
MKMHEELVERILAGIKQAEEGKTINRGDFSQHLETEDNDDA